MEKIRPRPKVMSRILLW